MSNAEVSTDAALLLVDFDLPYLVSVSDSLDDPTLRAYVEAQRRGENPDPVPYSPRPAPGAMVLAQEVHVPKPEDLSTPFLIYSPHGPTELHFLRRVRNVDRRVIAGGELRPDRGAMAFSSVRCALGKEVIANGPDGDRQNYAIDVAMDALNRFLARYRYATGAYWAHPLSFNDCVEFAIHTINSDGRDQTQTASYPGGGPLIGFGADVLLDESRDTRIRQGLARPDDDDLPHAHEVIQSAEDHLSRGRFRSAIIDAGTAIEVFVSDLLRKRLAQLGFSHDDVVAMFVDDHDRPLSITAIIKGPLRDPAGIDLAGRAEYATWVTAVRDPRNRVVHGADRNPSADAARAAIRASNIVAATLQQLLHKEDEQ